MKMLSFEAIALLAHGGLDAMEPEELAKVAACVLDAATRVVDQPVGSRWFWIAIFSASSRRLLFRRSDILEVKVEGKVQRDVDRYDRIVAICTIGDVDVGGW